MTDTNAERELRELFDRAGRAMPVDTAQFVSAVDERMAAHGTSARRPTVRPLGVIAITAAAAAVVAGVMGSATLRDRTAVPAATPSATTTATTATTAPTPAVTDTPVEDPAAADLPDGVPPLTPGMALPKSQQEVDLRHPDWAHEIVGKTIGLARVHIDGRPANVILAPARSPARHGNPAAPAACILIVPASQPINALEMRGRSIHCADFPTDDTPAPPDGGHLPSIGLNDPATSTVDEYRKVMWPLVGASSAVAAVDFQGAGVKHRLQYRLTLPGVDGALFVGFLPYEPVPIDTRIRLTGYDDAGKVVAERG